MDEESLIREQIEYYRRRAPEYDETASPPNDPIARYARRVEEALHEFAPAGDILEIASGTGTWTKVLLHYATNVTALDASAEMHQRSLMKLGDRPQFATSQPMFFLGNPIGATTWFSSQTGCRTYHQGSSSVSGR